MSTIYEKKNGEKSSLKNIRLSNEELDKWDSKEIHDFLQGKNPNNNEAQNELLKQLFELMGKMEFVGEVDDSDVELLEKIKKVM